MKKIACLAILHFLLLGSLKSFADTCPRMKDIHPALPPAGWTFLVPPISSLDTFFFFSANHFLNGPYYQQVICIYSTPGSFPLFSLISDHLYQEPREALFPWNWGYSAMLDYLLTCTPGDHDPAHCSFQ